MGVVQSNDLEMMLSQLRSAICKNRSSKYCLSLWSKFIRHRDGNRCIVCGSKGRLVAHHIFRKSFLEIMKYSTGNGITLCLRCHKEPHEDFNRKANMNLPMDAEGGEKIEQVLFYLQELLSDARERRQLRDDFYNFSERALIQFKRFQELEPHLGFPGTSFEQAYLIWRQTPRSMMRAVLEANGFSLPQGYIQGIRPIQLR